MSGSHDFRAANLLGALSLAVADEMTDVIETAARHGAAAPAALVALHEFLEGGSMDELRRVVGLTPSGAVRLIDRLEADGCVERRAGASARTVSLTLTAKGQRTARAVLSARTRVLDNLVAGLTKPEQALLAQLSAKLLQGITKDLMNAGEPGEPLRADWLCRLCDLRMCGRDVGSCPVAEAAGEDITTSTRLHRSSDGA